MEHPSAPKVSVVVPVYGSDSVLPELFSRVTKTLESIPLSFELILVNDASPDNAWKVTQELAAKDSRVRGVNLSRNFGQYAAITAGLAASKGEWVVVMDCDLQDQPEEMAQMYKKVQEGYFAVVGSRQKRHDGALRIFVSRAFYATLGYLTGTRVDPTLANFGIYHRRVIDAVLSVPDHTRYFSVMKRWVGFRTAIVPVMAAPRRGGKSGYSLRKLFALATDIILAYSDKPLRIIIKVGAVISVIAGAYLAFILGSGIAKGSVPQIQMLVASLWLIFGLLSSIMGIMALYLAKTFEEVKKRPIYIVQEEI